MRKQKVIMWLGALLLCGGVVFAYFYFVEDNIFRGEGNYINGDRAFAEELGYDKDKPLYYTDAGLDLEYANAIYVRRQKELVPVIEINKEANADINELIKRIALMTNTYDLLNWVVYYNNPASNYLASAEYNIQSGLWDIFVNIDRAEENRRETEITIIHEFAHILSLNKGEMYLKVPPRLCWTHFVPEGCLRKDSYLYEFWKEFWKGNYSEDELDVSDYAERNYKEHSDWYVSEYAASNPAEDFAESFMFFVTGDNFGNKKIATEKVDFFLRYPEFNSLKKVLD